MPDTIPTSATLDPKVQAVAQDALDAANLGKAVVNDAKSMSAMQAIFAHLPAIIAAGQKDIADVTAALPVIKAGWRTTEFWLAAGMFLGNSIYLMVTGHALPVDLNVVLGAVAIIYTAARSFVKSAPAQAPTLAK